MKQILFPAFLIFQSLCSFAQTNAPVTELKATASPVNNAPVTEVKKAEETLTLKEDSYDFGKIPQGKPVTHIFEVTNIGKAPMTIANVQASCGCTTPEWDKDKSIAPGTSTNITVGYNAAAEGPFTKLVTVTYGENLNKQITIKGEVWKTPTSSAPVNENVNDLKN